MTVDAAISDLCCHWGYTDAKPIGDGRYAALLPFLFTHAIIVGRWANKWTYEDRWCYATPALALEAFHKWDGQGEPDGWHRHPPTGRRRPEGNHEQEYVNF